MDRESVAERWREVLKNGGYEPPRLAGLALYRLRWYSRVWRRLHSILRIVPRTTFFELGCGGGAHLVPLAFHGHEVAGIDASPQVLDRCRAYVKAVERYAGRPLSVTLHSGDFLRFEHDHAYGVVFNFGVVEHFLDESERLEVLKRMLRLAKPGGHVVSVVPSGMHPLRARMRTEGLGGYVVPEIDYTDEYAATEIVRAGAIDPRVLPANLCGYLAAVPDAGPRRVLRRATFLAAQVLPPLPSRWAFRHASSLIIIGKKPER